MDRNRSKLRQQNDNKFPKPVLHVKENGWHEGIRWNSGIRVYDTLQKDKDSPNVIEQHNEDIVVKLADGRRLVLHQRVGDL